jgi:hypothetical protein
MNTDLQYSHYGSSHGIGAVPLIIGLAVLVLWVASMWKVFTKAGKPGWAAIIPIYNVIVLLEIAGKPGWWIVLYLIPVVSLIVSIIVLVSLANNFGKGVGFALGILFLPVIFLPILAFGSARYVGSTVVPGLPMARAAQY